MAQSGGGKSKIANWERFDKTWSHKTGEVDKRVKQDFNQSMSEMRKIMQLTNMGDTEKAQRFESIFKNMKAKGTYQHLPDEVKADVSKLLPEEKKTMVETKHKQEERQHEQDADDGVDAGPANLNPQHSTASPHFSHKQHIGEGSQETEAWKTQISSSPRQSHKQHGGEGSQETEELKKQIEQLKKELAVEKKVAEKRKTELEENKKEHDIKEAEIKHCTERYDVMQKEKQQTISTMEKQLENSHADEFKLQEQLKRRTYEFEGIKKKLKETLEENSKLIKQMQHLEKKHEAHMDRVSETMADDKRKYDSEMQKLTKDRDDIRDRFSKLAGAKLSDQNADIADLSDPNRAMKLSERFGQLYDDEWTNAFETLAEKKMGLSLKEAIDFLLRLLQDCWYFCNALLTTQMESLHIVFLHPAQNMAKIDPRKNVGGLKDRPRIGSKEEKTLRDVRRMIGVGPSVIEEVKQCFLSEAKSWSKEKTGYDKKHIEACAPYIQKCAEVCWLMAVHDPPLYMKMDVKPGEKLDLNVYSVYSLSGHTIDFLVWPPLLNGKDGGLLAKGVAEPQRIVGKKK